jgi:hypothetical protein
MVRPVKYATAAERPVSVSVRMPHALYDQADAFARMRHLTMSELLIDALQLRLDTPADPRDIVQSQDKDVMAEVQAMVDAAVQAALAQRSPMPVHVGHHQRHQHSLHLRYRMTIIIQ